METDNPFEKVLDRLREKGWIKNEWGENDGPNCIMGALQYATGLSNWGYKTDTLCDLAEEHYPERISGCVNSVSFNNHPDTTFSDVERVLEKAAVKWEEERVLRND